MTIRVRATSNVHDLGTVIAHGIYDNKDVTLRAIGAGPISQAIKATTIACSQCALRGTYLAFIPGWTTLNLPDRDRPGQRKDVSAMTIRVITLH